MGITISKVDACYIVTFPDHVTLDCLIDWGSAFKSKLEGEVPKSLLLDTKLHNFESIDCLKWLREFLTDICVVNNEINKVAFVQPRSYRESEIVSTNEAYFSELPKARKWLNG